MDCGGCAGTGTLLGVSADSGKDAWAVGQTTGGAPLAEHSNGTSWRQVTVPNSTAGKAALTAVSAASPADAWAVRHITGYGNPQLAYHWDGTGLDRDPGRYPNWGFPGRAGVADVGPGNA